MKYRYTFERAVDIHKFSQQAFHLSRNLGERRGTEEVCVASSNVHYIFFRVLLAGNCCSCFCNGNDIRPIEDGQYI